MRRGNTDPAGWEEEVIFNTTGVNATTTAAPTYEIRNHPLRVGKNEIRITVRSTSTRSHPHELQNRDREGGAAAENGVLYSRR